MSDYSHPSEQKIRILNEVDNLGSTTSEGLSNSMGIKIEVARNQLSRYKRQGLLDYDRERDGRFIRYVYYLSDKGLRRLDYLERAEALMKSENVSWREALGQL